MRGCKAGLPFQGNLLPRKKGEEEAYKQVKDNGGSKGRGPIWFHFYTEIDELPGAQHDVAFPSAGTSQRLEACRLEAEITSVAVQRCSWRLRPAHFNTSQWVTKR